MTFLFKNYWGTRIFMPIMIESMYLVTQKGGRRITYIGFLNFCLIIRHKPKFND